ncbi:sugar phosphate isomerase/epimerase family protein [Paenibacillus shunpengii]|uniref:Sugar phosphate isomerase/epimerase family protein n=1 Tax=Paenibacillus shunpengii TaxID=2054424 RepID=A0ABW5SJC4_9BACL|nr:MULTISPECIES: sugar phosphate isomerase/epimerase family protein [unclassified Paenibacillus]OMC72042.1 xylose isomerase [Paenibacillus sp. FSL H7-0326]SDX33872.1 Sugar phosphate isomerase/epimerase [Paenibacillus sp. PDC88]
MSFSNKIGVISDSFQAGLKGGLVKAKEVGAEGVQIYAVSGEMAPENLTSSDRKQLRSYIADLGLEISALCGDLGGHGFQDAAANREKIERSKRILDLAVELGTDVVTTHIGIVPDDVNGSIYSTMQEACEELGVYAKSMNAYFAIETGPERAAHLKSFLDSLSTNGVSVNFDPANMVMVTGDDPVEGVKLLKDYIVHTHVKDGRQIRPIDPKEVYGYLGYEGMTHEKIAEMASSGAAFLEVPLGEGQVDFDAYFAALQEIGYKGYLTIEREVGSTPEEDIKKAVQFIKKFRGY